MLLTVELKTKASQLWSQLGDISQRVRPLPPLGPSSLLLKVVKSLGAPYALFLPFFCLWSEALHRAPPGEIPAPGARPFLPQ